MSLNDFMGWALLVGAAFAADAGRALDAWALLILAKLCWIHSDVQGDE